MTREPGSIPCAKTELPIAEAAGFLRHPLLAACGVAHGFGLRDAPLRPDVVRPKQVHGCVVSEPRAGGRAEPARADAIVSRDAGVAVGIVAADCVPILASRADGLVVAAIHAGWRGLARGVVHEALERLRAGALSETGSLRAVIGPHIGACCYEVDAPVIDALTARFGAGPVAEALAPTRPGHARIDLARLVERELAASGIGPPFRARIDAACTRCDAARFHSFRRDGAAAGRLLHFIAARTSFRVA